MRNCNISKGSNFKAIPLAMWLFGPLWLMAGTLLLIATLYRLDRGIQALKPI